MNVSIYNVSQAQDQCDTPDRPGVSPDWTGTLTDFVDSNSEDCDLVELVSAMADGDAAYHGGGAAQLVWVVVA